MSEPKETRIFVFGSNTAGRHGAGAALFARQHRGAVYGVGIGIQGQSYGIPTLSGALTRLPLSRIAMYVRDFLAFADSHPEMRFQVTPIGCGLAGFKPAQIGPMFKGAPENCDLPHEFSRFVKEKGNENIC